MSCSPVLTDYNGTDLTYDAVGNMTDYGNNLHFTWDKGNQLASVVFDLYSLTVSYKYDQNGMRTQKLTCHGDGSLHATGTVLLTH